ncbi:MAG: acetate--CoA ligase family protein, partial [Solirubrobacterales bacterium]
MGLIDELVQRARAEGRAALSESEGKRLLAVRGVAVPDGSEAGSARAAADAAEQLGFPVALKIASPDVLHKSDVGGVRLNLADAAAVAQAYDQVTEAVRAQRPEARVGTVLVERMARAGQEVIVGLIRDPLFGPVVMVGLGGIFVEVLGDVAFRLAPITRDDARQMLAELRGARLLEGARGRPAVDREALVDLLMTVAGPGGLAEAADGAIEELDLNPVFAYPDGLLVADARVVLSGSAQSHADRGPDRAERLATMQAVFEPRSVAIIGASTEEEKLGYRAVKNLVDFGYAGDLYPIHPRAAEIYGRKAYPRVTDVPGPVERAIVTVPSGAILEVIDQCVAKGVRIVHIYTGGFGELNAAGRELERQMLARAAGSGLRIIGPNSIGTYAPRGGLSPIVGANREPGGVAMVSQSGGLTYDTIRRGAYQGLRFSKAISIGNAIDLNPTDFLECYVDDPNTTVVGGYVESVPDGRQLRTVLERAAGRKPVAILKGGQTRSGQRAAASHTGALSSDFAIWNALFRQTGVAAVQTIEELLDTLLAFQMLPPMRGSGVALIGPGGGASVTATDAADRQGLQVVPFAQATVDGLVALNLPPGTSLVNPLDVPAGVLRLGGGAVLGQVLGFAADDPNVSALVVHLNLVPILALAPLEVTAGYVQNMVSSVLAL